MIRRTSSSSRIAAALAFAAMLGATAAVRAQNATTGTLGGVVRDAQLGVLPGASVVAIHAPTGTRYEAFTRADGRFDLLNAQVGPYELEIALSGFGTRALSGVVVTLGEATEVPVTLQLATVTETVEVTAQASSMFSPSRSGTTASVESGVIETLPTIERSLQDFARTNPFFVKTSRNADSESFLSVAGRSGRYNNIQIDGAVNNDLFGLAAQGTPGGQANTEPISLDAVSELQLVVAPYDVRQSGFSGGGINVITRSGSNRFSGTAYLYSRNQGLVGSGVDDVPIATFFDRQQGASVGGPLVRNRAFFFANVDTQRRETPVGYSLDGSSGVDFGRLAEGQDRMELTGWALVDNQTNTAYPAARLSLIAGQVNRAAVQPVGRQPVARLARAESVTDKVSPGATGPYYRYALPQTFDIRPRQQTQVELIQAPAVAFARTLRTQGGPLYSARSTQTTQPVTARLTIANETNNGLGVPLPAGLFSSFEQADGREIFQGGATVTATPVGGEMVVELGQSFDVTFERTVLTFIRTGSRNENVDTTQKLTLKNGGSRPAQVDIVESFRGEWKIVRESTARTQTSAFQVMWQVTVPANGETSLEYQAQIGQR